MLELPQVPEQIINRCKQLLLEQGGREKMLSCLRKHGVPKGQSCVILSRLTKMPIAEAQEIVHYSKTWKDMQSRDEELQNVMCEALDQLRAPETSDQ